MYEKNIDYFRGIFSSLIVLIHTYQILLLPLIYEQNSLLLKIIQSIGVYTVGCFFLISGYSIANNLHSNYLKNNKNINIKIFIKSRFYRIAPPFIYSIALLILIVFIIQYFELNGSELYRLAEDKYVPREKAIYDWEAILYNLFFLPSVIFNISTPSMNGPLWSINYEVYSYILTLFIFLVFINKYNSLKFIISLVFLLSFFIFQFTYNNYINYNFLYFFLYYCIGLITYFIKLKQLLSIKRIKQLFIVFLVIVFALMVYDINYFRAYQGIASFNTMIIFLIFLILFYSKYFSNRKLYLSDIFFSIAKYAYTIYIVHFPLLLLSLSLFHKNLFKMNIFELSILISCILFFIFKFSKYSSYIVERKNYRK